MAIVKATGNLQTDFANPFHMDDARQLRTCPDATCELKLPSIIWSLWAAHGICSMGGLFHLALTAHRTPAPQLSCLPPERPGATGHGDHGTTQQAGL
ncbi:hypothetical protein P7K49_023846, partial [Saguinus oedipus]